MLGPQMAAEPIKATQGQIGINFLVGAVAYMVASFTGGLVSGFSFSIQYKPQQALNDQTIL